MQREMQHCHAGSNGPEPTSARMGMGGGVEKILLVRDVPMHLGPKWLDLYIPQPPNTQTHTLSHLCGL